MIKQVHDGLHASEQERRFSSSANGKADLGEVLEYMRLLWELHHGLQATSKRMQIHLGVTGPQRLVLRMIGEFPAIIGRDVAKILCLHPSTVTEILGRLEQRKLVVRTRDRKDRRKFQFRLTATGRRVNQTKVGTVEAVVRQTIQRLSEDELQVTAKVLRMLTDNLFKRNSASKSPTVDRFS